MTFDVFGTVVDWRSSIARQLGDVLGQKGYHLGWVQLADEWRSKYQPSLEQVRSGQRPWTKLDILNQETLIQLLDEHTVTGLSDAEIEKLSRAWWRLDPWPDSVEGLQRIKRRFLIATLSNGNIALMANLAKYAGLPWDAILGAEVARAYKRQPEAYLRSAEALNLRPDQCLMVAAHNRDLASARSCGFQTAFVPRPTEDTSPQHEFDFIATDFAGLADLLEC